MGIARLLAKAWIAVCLYTGAVALARALPGSSDPLAICGAILGTLILFAATGILFAAGYGVPGGRFVRLKEWRPKRLKPSFDEAAVVLFAGLIFLVQTFYAPDHRAGPVPDGLEQAMYFAIPGQRVLVGQARHCMLDGGRIFSSAFAWFAALIYLASALSRLRRRAERFRRCSHAEIGPTALFLCAVSVAGIQLFYVGNGYAVMPCSLLAGIVGALAIELMPLLLAYSFATMLALLLAEVKHK
jgi:hypothetical protein